MHQQRAALPRRVVLGGHLVYRRRAAVDQADRSPEPRDFKIVLPFAELAEGVPHRITVWDEVARQEVGIVLVRQGGRVHAMGACCSHAGGPLDQGWVIDGTLVCPWHGSRYDPETGRPVDGPSTCPRPRYAVRLHDGIVELKREQEPGDEVVTGDSLAALPAGQLRDAASVGTGDADTTSRTATDVLFEHHQMIRRLFDRMLSLSGDAPQRHELMRTLASELDIHEIVEDAIFYPAVRPVSEDVDTAYAEHGVLADLLAVTIKLPTTSPAFDRRLLALQAAFLHHAGSEEQSISPRAIRLPEDRRHAARTAFSGCGPRGARPCWLRPRQHRPAFRRCHGCAADRHGPGAAYGFRRTRPLSFPSPW